jgi:hypothetical protein
MNTFCIGFVLAVISAWLLVSGYHMWSIPEFTEIQQTIFNGKITFGGLLAIGTLIVPWAWWIDDESNS